MIKALARALRRLLGGGGGEPVGAAEDPPGQRIDAARDRLRQTIPPPEDPAAEESPND